MVNEEAIMVNDLHGDLMWYGHDSPDQFPGDCVNAKFLGFGVLRNCL